ncbi:MAG: MipA/OmpV family protein [Epsilonproteobacteria bacterium]|nr:MipA/OmpV family protein [Campylobacterota bacterium]
MKQLKVLILFMMSIGLSLQASEYKVKGAIGVAGEHIYSVYDGVDTATKFIPMLFIQHEDFYAEGRRFGRYMYKDNCNAIGAGVSIEFTNLDRNDNEALKVMNELSGRVNANLVLNRKSEFFELLALVDRDISDRSKGWRILTQVSKPMVFDKLTIEPKLGLLWSDEKTNAYLYGVSSQKATSNYASYSPDDSFEPYVELNMRYRLTDLLGIIGAAKYKRLDDTVIDSPLVDQKEEITLRLGFVFFFKL